MNEGDIVGIDVGSIYDGFYGDHAKTFCVGKVSKDALKLVDITKQSLDIGKFCPRLVGVSKIWVQNHENQLNT